MSTAYRMNERSTNSREPDWEQRAEERLSRTTRMHERFGSWTYNPYSLTQPLRHMMIMFSGARVPPQELPASQIHGAG